jgi:hypothetical protein
MWIIAIPYPDEPVWRRPFLMAGEMTAYIVLLIFSLVILLPAIAAAVLVVGPFVALNMIDCYLRHWVDARMYPKQKPEQKMEKKPEPEPEVTREPTSELVDVCLT